MKITCIEKQVGQLLGEAFYKIPRFQRPYSWERTHVEEFWNDTVVDNEGDYFIGNFVVYDDKGVLAMVDGQQRLTTITLLLCALRNAFSEQGLRNLAEGIHGRIERANIKNERFFVLQSETSYPYFQEHIQKFGAPPEVDARVGPEEELLKQAFDYLRSRVDDTVRAIGAQASLSQAKKQANIEDELARIRDRVLGLKLIFTSLDNDDDAYMIFETLNTRGKDLTLSDLVKSQLSRLLKPTNKGVDIAKDKWAQIAEIFEESQADLNISTFIHHVWLSRYEYITEKKLYKALKRRIKKDQAASFLNDLVIDSKIYRQIHEPTFRKWRREELEIRDSLNGMNLFHIKQQLPMVLSVLRQYDDGMIWVKHVRRVLSAIENFHFAFTAVTSQRSSGGISFMYASGARNLHDATKLTQKAKLLGDFQKKLASKRPPYAEFELVFTELRSSSKFTKQKALVKYVLTKLYQHHSAGLAIDADRMTVEHLAPENPLQSSGLNDEQVASIGNLILVDEPLNNKLANKGFTEKRAILQTAKVWVDPVVFEATVWGAKEISDRAKILAKDSYDKVWRV